MLQTQLINHPEYHFHISAAQRLIRQLTQSEIKLALARGRNKTVKKQSHHTEEQSGELKMKAAEDKAGRGVLTC